VTRSLARAAIDQAHQEAQRLAGVDNGLACIALAEAGRLEDLLGDFIVEAELPAATSSTVN
jgi:hypothetical protein